MSDWREAIGDSIRQWSDEAEPYGYRIKMECWEDYHPEYTGIRKQTEYNEDLVKPSNLFFALFRYRCGDFTKEEIRMGQQYVETGVHVVQHLTGQNAPDVEAYLSSVNDIELHGVTTCYEAIGYIASTLNDYIATLPKYRQLPPKTDAKLVYATIPTDREKEGISLGNMIRSLDSLCEDLLEIRCRLRFKSFDDLRTCDYFVSILKDTLSDTDRDEIDYAIRNTSSESHPSHSLLYYNYDNKALETFPELKELINAKGAFNECFDSMHRIKYNLLVWLLSQRLLVIDQYCGLQVKNGIVAYRKYPIILASAFRLDGNSDEQILDKLLEQINIQILRLVKHTSQEAENSMDLQRLDNDIKKTISVIETTDRLQDKAVKEQMSILSEIRARIAYIQANEKENISELLELYSRQISIEEGLVDRQRLSPQDLLRSELERIKYVENHNDIAEELNLDEDQLYGRIVELADRYSILDPAIESKRMNLANYYARNNDHDEALRIYGQTLANMHYLDDGSALMVNYLPPLYLNYIHNLRELGYEVQATIILTEFERNIERWNDYNLLDLDVRAYRILAISARLTFRNSRKFKDYIPMGIEYWNLLVSGIDLRIPKNHRLWDDVYCYFSVALSAAIVDSGTDEQILPQMKLLVKQGIEYLEEGLEIEASRKQSLMANLYHNLAFACFNSHHKREGRFYMSKVLDLRRKIYHENHIPVFKGQIAEALLLLGASYVNGRNEYMSCITKAKALSYADECLSIYTELNEGFLEQETHVYQARLLKGTILCWCRGHEYEGWTMVKECYDWSLQNPINSYREVFEEEYNRFKELMQ